MKFFATIALAVTLIAGTAASPSLVAGRAAAGPETGTCQYKCYPAEKQCPAGWVPKKLGTCYSCCEIV